MTTPPPDWHPDPSDPRQLRYWDGGQWTQHTAPVHRATAGAVQCQQGSARAVVSMVAVWAVVVAQVAAAIIAITWRGAPSDQDIRLLVPPVLLVIPFHIAAYLACCLWLSQARANAEVLNPRARHALRKGWVWGGWICPIVLLWFPYVLVRDVARATGSTAGGSWWPRTASGAW